MLAAIAGCALSLSSHPLYAQTTPSPEGQAMQRQIDEMNQQVKTLEQIQQGARVIPAEKAEAPNQTSVRQGIAITSPNGELQLRFRALSRNVTH